MGESGFSIAGITLKFAAVQKLYFTCYPAGCSINNTGIIVNNMSSCQDILTNQFYLKGKSKQPCIDAFILLRNTYSNEKQTYTEKNGSRKP
jgi:L-serine deaminase